MSRYYYFGQDAQGCYADNDKDERHYMDRDKWLQFIHAANVPEPAQRVRLQIKEAISVDVYEGDQHQRTVALTPDITEI